MPRYIPASRLSPEEFWEDVAQVLPLVAKINGSPMQTRILDIAGDGGWRIALSIDGQEVGIIWADRFNPTNSISPDYIQEIAPARNRSNAKYAYVITTARVSPGALYLAKNAHIQMIDGEHYEQMRARAYKWESPPKPDPIYFDNSPKPIETRREASQDEINEIYSQRGVKRQAGGNKPNQLKPVQLPATPKPNLPPEQEDQIGILTQKEREVILSWRRGNKAEAAKIILND